MTYTYIRPKIAFRGRGVAVLTNKSHAKIRHLLDEYCKEKQGISLANMLQNRARDKFRGNNDRIAQQLGNIEGYFDGNSTFGLKILIDILEILEINYEITLTTPGPSAIIKLSIE